MPISEVTTSTINANELDLNQTAKDVDKINEFKKVVENVNDSKVDNVVVDNADVVDADVKALVNLFDKDSDVYDFNGAEQAALPIGVAAIAAAGGSITATDVLAPLGLGALAVWIASNDSGVLGNMSDNDVLADAAAASSNNNFNVDDISTSSILGGLGSEFPLSDLYTKNSLSGIAGDIFDVPSIGTFPSVFDSDITQGGSVFGEVITDYNDLPGFQGKEVGASVNFSWIDGLYPLGNDPFDLDGINDEGFKRGPDVGDIVKVGKPDPIAEYGSSSAPTQSPTMEINWGDEYYDGTNRGNETYDEMLERFDAEDEVAKQEASKAQDEMIKRNWGE